MPRRFALTEAQLDTLLALPEAESDPIRHWTLSAADLAVIERRRGRHRMFAPGHGRDMLAWLLPVALATTNAMTVAAALMDEFRRRRIIAPGPSVVDAWLPPP